MPGPPPVPGADAVVLELGRRLAPRVAAGAAVCFVLGGVALSGAVAAAREQPGVGAVVAVLALLVLALGLACLRALQTGRHARVVLDADGVRWLDRDAVRWDVPWERVDAVAVSVLTSRRPPGQASLRNEEHLVRLVLAFPADDAAAREKPLARLLTRDEPEPWTHKVPFGTWDADWRTALDDGLRRFAPERYRGVLRRDVRARRYA